MIAGLLWVALLLVLLVIGRSAHGLPRGVSEHYYAFEIVALPFVLAAQVFGAHAVLRRADHESARTLAHHMVCAFVLVIVIPDWIALLLELTTGGSQMRALFPATQLLAGVLVCVVAYRHTRSLLRSVLATIACVLPALLLR